jgi:hypothetical protein
MLKVLLNIIQNIRLYILLFTAARTLKPHRLRKVRGIMLDLRTETRTQLYFWVFYTTVALHKHLQYRNWSDF